MVCGVDNMDKSEKKSTSFPVMGSMCFKWHPSDRGGSVFGGRSGYSILRIVFAAPRSAVLLRPQQRTEPVLIIPGLFEPPVRTL